jgi:hypothetical protein
LAVCLIYKKWTAQFRSGCASTYIEPPTYSWLTSASLNKMILTNNVPFNSFELVLWFLNNRKYLVMGTWSWFDAIALQLFSMTAIQGFGTKIYTL